MDITTLAIILGVTASNLIGFIIGFATGHNFCQKMYEMIIQMGSEDES